MAKLVDTTEWREFRVGDLFEVKHPTRARSLKQYSDGDVAFVATGVGEYGNGVSSYVQPFDDEQLDKGGCVTVSPVDGKCFWQPNDFCGRGGAGSSILLCYPKDVMFNDYVGGFIAAVLTDVYGGWTYGNAGSGSVVKQSCIKLPATPDGKPDWDYMEQYMARVMDEMQPVAEELHSLESTLSLHAVDVSEWKEFHLYDEGMFDITMGNKFDKIRMAEGDDCNFVGRSGVDNGVACRVTFVDGVEPYASGCLTLALGGSIGSCFVQTDAFYTSQNVAVLEPKQKVERSALEFAATAIMKVAQTKYAAFQNELNRHVRTDFVCKLPATSDGKPDWDKMAEMMRGYTDSVREVAEVLGELGRA